MEALSFVVWFAAAALCFAGLLAAGSNDDDDQAIRFKATSGPFSVAVFAPPGDLAAGSSPFSVLVQDRNTQEVLLDATVDLATHPAADTQGTSSTARASSTDSQNKLLQTADLNLANPGAWTLNIAVRHNSDSGHFSAPFHVVKLEGGIAYPFSYAAIAVFSAILIGVYVGRRSLPRVERPASI